MTATGDGGGYCRHAGNRSLPSAPSPKLTVAPDEGSLNAAKRLAAPVGGITPVGYFELGPYVTRSMAIPSGRTPGQKTAKGSEAWAPSKLARASWAQSSFEGVSSSAGDASSAG